MDIVDNKLKEYFQNKNIELFISFFLEIINQYKNNNYEYKIMEKINQYIIDYFIKYYKNINELDLLNSIINIFQKEELDELLFNFLNIIRTSKKIDYYKKGRKLILYIILPYKNRVDFFYRKISNIIPENKINNLNIIFFQIFDNNNILVCDSNTIYIIDNINYQILMYLKLNTQILNIGIFLKTKIIIISTFKFEIYEIKDNKYLKINYFKKIDFDNNPYFIEFSNKFIISSKNNIKIFENINNQNYQEIINISIKYHIIEKTNFNFFIIFYDKYLYFYNLITYENYYSIEIENYKFNLVFNSSLNKINDILYLLILYDGCYLIDIFKRRVINKLKNQIYGIISLLDNSFLILGNNKLMEHVYFEKKEIKFIGDKTFFLYDFSKKNPIQKNNIIYFTNFNMILNLLKIILKNN